MILRILADAGVYKHQKRSFSGTFVVKHIVHMFSLIRCGIRSSRLFNPLLSCYDIKVQEKGPHLRKGIGCQ